MGRPPLAIVGLLDQQFLISFSLVKNTNEGRGKRLKNQFLIGRFSFSLNSISTLLFTISIELNLMINLNFLF